MRELTKKEWEEIEQKKKDDVILLKSHASAPVSLVKTKTEEAKISEKDENALKSEEAKQKTINVSSEINKRNVSHLAPDKSDKPGINEDGFVKTLSLTSLLGVNFSKKKEEPKVVRKLDIE